MTCGAFTRGDRPMDVFGRVQCFMTLVTKFYAASENNGLLVIRVLLVFNLLMAGGAFTSRKRLVSDLSLAQIAVTLPAVQLCGNRNAKHLQPEKNGKDRQNGYSNPYRVAFRHHVSTCVPCKKPAPSHPDITCRSCAIRTGKD